MLAIREAFKLALSMMLMYWLALWQDWNMPGNGGLAIALVSMGSAGASFNKGVLRIVGTSWGLLMGFLALDLFGQSPAGFLIGASLYIVVVGYMMQTSTASYAWNVAGFLPFMVWSSSYMSDDMGSAAFRYGSFRYLETTTGILIYTLVSIVIWPIRAGDNLKPQGKVLWSVIADWFGKCREELKGRPDDGGMVELRGKVAASSSALMASLEASFSDSSKVRQDKALWETMRVNLSGLIDAMELWHESVRDVRDLDLEKYLQGSEMALDRFAQRLQCLLDRWSGNYDGSDGDFRLLEPLPLDWTADGREACSRMDAAVLGNFLLQWKLLDRLSIELLRGTRMIAGLDPRHGKVPDQVVPDRSRRVLWDPQRLLKALFPATCFVVAYIFWILLDPPGGPSIPGTVVALSLNSVLTRVNPQAMLLVLLLGLWICVAPLYMWVMPALGSGAGLLAMIFIYTFVFGWLGSKKPVLKLIPLLLLTSVAGISNQQTYSFMALVGGGMMFLLCLSAIALVDLLWNSAQPQQVMAGGLRRFFRGCASVVEGFGPERSGWGRKRHYDSKVAGVPASIQAASKQLNLGDGAGCSEKDVASVVQGLQSISLRLQALELAHQQLDPDGQGRLPGSTGEALRAVIVARLTDLSKLKIEDHRGETDKKLKSISAEIVAWADSSSGATPVATQAVVGSVRGLLAAIEDTRKSMVRIDWAALSKPRF